MGIRVASLHIYPIKSCAAIDCDTIEIGERGPRFDREWMLVDAATRKFLTQRELPTLTMIRPILTKTMLVISVPQDNGEVAEISLPAENYPVGKVEVEVWGESCEAYEAAPLASEAISRFLNKEVKLVRMAGDFKRRASEKMNHPETTMSFTDSAPVLLTASGSLAELNSRLRVPVPMDRFRPNIFIEGTDAYVEDKWKSIQIGSVEFDVVAACTRCIIVNTDQLNGMRGAEPLRTLSTYRLGPKKKVEFGQYLIQRSQGTIAVGDEVVIHT